MCVWGTGDEDEKRELYILSEIDYQDNGRLDIKSGNVEVSARRES